jgi:hypothetical protein
MDLAVFTRLLKAGALGLRMRNCSTKAWCLMLYAAVAEVSHVCNLFGSKFACGIWISSAGNGDLLCWKQIVEEAKETLGEGGLSNLESLRRTTRTAGGGHDATRW